MRPDDLKTTFTALQIGQPSILDVIEVHEGGVYRSHFRAAPREAPKIVKRLAMYPELVDLLTQSADAMAEIDEHGEVDGDLTCLEDAIRDVLARCQEEPK